jgi:DNA replication protein DnaC
METIQEKIARSKVDIERRAAEREAKRARMTPEEIQAEKDEAERQRRANCDCDPDCPICNGLGYTRDEQGYRFDCPTYAFTKLKQRAGRYGMTSNELENLKWSIIQDNNNIREIKNKIIEVLNRGYGWIFLWGDHGLGKSLLLKASIADALRIGQDAAYVNMVNILDDIKKSYDSDDYDSKFEWWQGLPILAIDEFNRVKSSEWADERRFALMDARYVQAIRHETVTLIASNTSPEQQDSYLRDRILDGRFEVIKLIGPSARKSIKNKDFMF